MRRTIRRASVVVATITLALVAFWDVPAAGGPSTVPLKFGMDVRAVEPLTSAGVKPDYAVLWAGVWLQRSGWTSVDRQLDKLHGSDVTPVVQFYYWGDDISRNCLEKGCWSALHGAWKDKTGWQRLGEDLVGHLNARMKGKPVVIVLEPEFNKNDAATYEPLDGYLAAKATYFRSDYPNAVVVLGFGNWAYWHWKNFDRAAEASNLVGLQGMRASTRDSLESYRDLVPSLLDGVRKLTARFHKGVLITDLALSSHWEPRWLGEQHAGVQALMDRRAEFRNAGAIGVVYRSLYDSALADTKNYYGEGERHFGLAWASNKTWKPSMTPWVEGVAAERNAANALPGIPVPKVPVSAEQAAVDPSTSDLSDNFVTWNFWARFATARWF